MVIKVKSITPLIVSLPKNEVTTYKSKHVEDLYVENYKLLMKEMKEDLSKWRDINGLEKINIVKMSVLPKMIIGLMQFLLESQQDFL